MIIGNNLANGLNYLYHLIIGRILGPGDYGQLAAVISLVGLITVIPVSLGLVLTKFVSASTSDDQAAIIIHWFKGKIAMLTVIIVGLIVLLAPLLISFLRINYVLFSVFTLFFLFYVPVAMYRAILQGLFKFGHIVNSFLLENAARLVGSVVLVLLGVRVLGGLMGFLIGAIIAFIFLILIIKKYSYKGVSNITFKEVSLYGLPVLVNSIATTSLYSTDVILARHFLDNTNAGIYAALSTLGKIIFFATAPIIGVMFPIISKKKSLGESYLKTLLFSIILVTFISICVLVVYGLFPKLTVNILYGSAFSSASVYLFLVGLMMLIFTLANLLINFYLSLGVTKIVYLPIIAAILQVIFISLWHNDLMSVIYSTILADLFLLTARIVE